MRAEVAQPSLIGEADDRGEKGEEPLNRLVRK